MEFFLVHAAKGKEAWFGSLCIRGRRFGLVWFTLYKGKEAWFGSPCIRERRFGLVHSEGERFCLHPVTRKEVGLVHPV